MICYLKKFLLNKHKKGIWSFIQQIISQVKKEKDLFMIWFMLKF